MTIELIWRFEYAGVLIDKLDISKMEALKASKAALEKHTVDDDPIQCANDDLHDWAEQ